MKRLIAVLIIASGILWHGCESSVAPADEESERWITPPKENLRMALISQTDSSSEIFVQLRNGPYGGKNPEFHFIVEWRDKEGRGQSQEYWTWLYRYGWVDYYGKTWLKDTLKTIEPFDTVYTDLSFPDCVFPNQINVFWIQAIMKTP